MMQLNFSPSMHTLWVSEPLLQCRACRMTACRRLIRLGQHATVQQRCVALYNCRLQLPGLAAAVSMSHALFLLICKLGMRKARPCCCVTAALWTLSCSHQPPWDEGRVPKHPPSLLAFFSSFCPPPMMKVFLRLFFLVPAGSWTQWAVRVRQAHSILAHSIT